jgi:2-iminobutanoate/2-iminopropanoate deaminase
MRIAPPISGVAAPQGHYSHAVVSTAGELLWVAGQVPLGPGGAVVEGDVRAQATQVLVNLEQVLVEAGASLDDVVKTTTFLVDLADRAAVGEVRRARFADPPPANSLLVVRSLADPAFRVEIEAVAALPAGR